MDMIMNSRIRIMTTTAMKLVPLIGSGFLMLVYGFSSAGQF